MVRSYRYVHLDVFTDALFGGNQLAVFLDGRGLSTEEMQAMAKEMNFSETTFVLPPEREDTDARMRIFTPSAELPMAGHPTVGSAFALARAGVVRPDTHARFVFGLGVGPVAVALTWSSKGEELQDAWMTQSNPTFGPAAAPGSPAGLLAAAALGLGVEDMDASGLPLQVGSSGLAFLYVPLASRDAVDRARLDYAKLCEFYEAAGIGRGKGCFVFSTAGGAGEDEGEGGVDATVVYSRMFAPNLGIEEDPATGSASGPLGGYLVLHGAVPVEAAGRIVNLQGVKMGRRSVIHISVDVDDEQEPVQQHGGGGGGDGAKTVPAAGPKVTGVRVGGQSVVAGEGTLYL